MATVGRAGVPTMRQYENMFKDILGRSGLHYGYGKHFLDKTERFTPDDLFTDVRAGVLKMGRRPSYVVGTTKQTILGRVDDLPIEANSVLVQAKFTAPEGTTIAFEVSMDGGDQWAGVTFVYDATRDIQVSEIMGLPQGNKLRVQISMDTGDAHITPTVEWVMIMFNGV